MYYYALTITDVRGGRSYHSYEDYIDKLNYNVVTKGYEYCPEGDKLPNRGLHVHLLVASKKRLTKKSACLYPYGWSIRLELLPTHKDIGIWAVYCSKHICDNIELEQKIDSMYTNQSSAGADGGDRPRSRVTPPISAPVSPSDDGSEFTDPQYCKFMERIKTLRLV